MKFMTRDNRWHLHQSNRWHLHQSSTPSRGISESALMSEIGRDLHSVYTDLLKEPLPEHLACIVRKLDKRDGSAH